MITCVPLQIDNSQLLLNRQLTKASMQLTVPMSTASHQPATQWERRTPMIEIRLKRAHWFFDPDTPLGPPGGFGTVFQGQGEDGRLVAVKQLKVGAEEAGHRELAVADVIADRDLSHVIPMFDAGLDPGTDRYFLVMAQAECSLQDVLGNGPLPEEEVVAVLSDIVAGLVEVGDLVHRDLKPGNVLRHNGSWKIADFGIARFVEESTSLRTLKGCLTPPYAAPEQWRLERSTHATDVYALGCVAYHLITGQPPFGGGTDSIRRAHLYDAPPPIAASPRLTQLVLRCLLKSQSSRPTLDAVGRQLEAMQTNAVSISAIAEAGRAVAAEQTKREAEAAQQLMVEQGDQERARDGFTLLELMIDQLFTQIETDAPGVAHRSDDKLRIRLGSGGLNFDFILPYIQRGAFKNWGKHVVAGALVLVWQETGDYHQRSANLWYADLDGSYRWWEYAYFPHASLESSWNGVPFGIRTVEQIELADFAAAQYMGGIVIANRPVPVDGGEVADFTQRWAERLAQAAMNALQEPRRLPEA